jgi:hypothetical protein
MRIIRTVSIALALIGILDFALRGAAWLIVFIQ